MSRHLLLPMVSGRPSLPLIVSPTQCYVVDVGPSRAYFVDPYQRRPTFRERSLEMAVRADALNHGPCLVARPVGSEWRIHRLIHQVQPIHYKGDQI
jgi:hypothetical protein